MSLAYGIGGYIAVPLGSILGNGPPPANYIGGLGQSWFDKNTIPRAEYTFNGQAWIKNQAASGSLDSIGVNGIAGSGTNPVLPDVNGNINVTGSRISSGLAGNNSISTISTSPNSYVIGIQTAGATASSDPGQAGVSSYNNAQFTIDANGFVSLNPNFNFSPNTIRVYTDDFITSINSNLISSELPWVQGGNYFTYGTGNSQHPGVVQNLVISATGVREVGLGSIGNSAASFYLGASTFAVNWIFNIATLSNSTNRYNFNVGMGDTATTAVQANGIWFGYSDNVNSGNWTFNTSSASTATNSNSSVAVTTGWHNAQIFINSTGTSVTFIMDGITLGTTTTNIPVTGISALLILQWVVGTIATGTISIDFFQMIQTLNTSR